MKFFSTTTVPTVKFVIFVYWPVRNFTSLMSHSEDTTPNPNLEILILFYYKFSIYRIIIQMNFI